MNDDFYDFEAYDAPSPPAGGLGRLLGGGGPKWLPGGDSSDWLVT